MTGTEYLETVKFKSLEVLEQKYYAYDIIAAFEAGQKDAQNLATNGGSADVSSLLLDFITWYLGDDHLPSDIDDLIEQYQKQ